MESAQHREGNRQRVRTEGRWYYRPLKVVPHDPRRNSLVTNKIKGWITTEIYLVGKHRRKWKASWDSITAPAANTSLTESTCSSSRNLYGQKTLSSVARILTCRRVNRGIRLIYIGLQGAARRN